MIIGITVQYNNYRNDRCAAECKQVIQKRQSTKFTSFDKRKNREWKELHTKLLYATVVEAVGLSIQHLNSSADSPLPPPPTTLILPPLYQIHPADKPDNMEPSQARGISYYIHPFHLRLHCPLQFQFISKFFVFRLIINN